MDVNVESQDVKLEGDDEDDKALLHWATTPPVEFQNEAHGAKVERVKTEPESGDDVSGEVS